MRKSILAVAVLILTFASMPLFAFSRSVTDDVIRMTKAGIAEDTIVEFVHKTRGPIDLNSDDILAMKDAGVSQKVIRAVVDVADNRDRDHSHVVVVAPYAYGYGYGYGYPYYDPFYYPYYYGPSLALGFGFGGFYGHFGHFGGHFGGGGGHFHGHR